MTRFNLASWCGISISFHCTPKDTSLHTSDRVIRQATRRAIAPSTPTLIGTAYDRLGAVSTSALIARLRRGDGYERQ